MAADGPGRDGLPVGHVEGAAARAGLQAGDCIVAVNGNVPLDVLDLEMAAADGVFWITVAHEGHLRELRLDPAPGEWHGVSLEHHGLGDRPRTCRNDCRFCFVDQVPRGLRPSLYVKDDDYRLSFLHGTFTTLTNLSDADLDRIETLRLSPLYVSLHAWDDEVRMRLMGRSARRSREVLERLAAAGLELHLQVVLCPGWNDGAVLEETVARCAGLPSVADVGIVPVSLAAEGELRRVTRDDARAVLAAVGGWQRRFVERRGVRFAHAADEFYLLCDEWPPPADAPEQYENGIGMVAALLDDAADVQGSLPAGTRLRVLCGTLAEPVVRRVGSLLDQRLGIGLQPFTVTNRLFGPHVTVTGLLGGREVLDALHERPLADDEWLLVPRVVVPAGLARTLDDVGEDELAAACGGRLVLAASLADAFARLSE